VLFDFDRSELRASAGPTLEAVADAARRSGVRPVQVEGYTDAKGADAYNLALSQKRADAVKAWLLAHGVAGDRLSAKGFGKARPVAPNTRPNGADDPDGRQKNRRVEVVIVDQPARR
jgi:outer membrane protein OmpA-like peptidoglycan-associated protein